jgi:hypothetical protein
MLAVRNLASSKLGKKLPNFQLYSIKIGDLIFIRENLIS